MENAKAWSQPSAIDYYSKHRHEVSDLYPSERVFLPRVLFPGIKVLDVGCASGGFFNIMRALEPTIDYTGIDIAEPAVDLARRTYQEARFEVADGVTIPFDDGTFDLVHCTSVLVIEPRYQEVWKEMYRVTSRFVLADMRLLKDIEGQGGLPRFSLSNPIRWAGTGGGSSLCSERRRRCDQLPIRLGAPPASFERHRLFP